MSLSTGAHDLDTFLSRMQKETDPPADATVAAIVGIWAVLPPDASAQQLRDAHQPRWDRLKLATAALQQLGNNGALADWRVTDPALDPDIAQALENFIHAQQALPQWADAEQLRRAEAMFMEHGPISCLLLFCASLPECYVLPDLAAVLHLAGQLEQHTEYRIRSTAALIFPIMMTGGLADDAGTGRAQILKVRLIHATIRNLILHGCPADVLLDMADASAGPDAGVIPAHPALQGERSMQAAMFGAGWDARHRGMPCNQQELAYTLLTFSYVFLRGMRGLGLPCAPEEERAFLHSWNVAASVLGVRPELMAHTMEEAAVLFGRMQTRGRHTAVLHDARPALGRALMGAMETSIPLAVFKPLPCWMTRFLCGQRTAALIGVDRRTPVLSQVLFEALTGFSRLVDTLARVIWPRFSISRLFTRVLGYHLITRLLMDQTRSLRLPTGLCDQAHGMLTHWSRDVRAPRWINVLEDWMTVRGDWRG